jgi:membrane protein
VGLLFFLATAVAMLLTVENTLNQIWSVKRNRPLPKRVGIYLLLLVLGPPALGASLWATSAVIGASLGWIGPLPPPARFVLNGGPVVLAWIGLACLYYFVPNTRVRRRDAIVGALVASVALELGKRGFAAYLLKAPTYKAVYGAFAVFPVFLLWVYFSWLVTLAAALLAANLKRRSVAAQSPNKHAIGAAHSLSPNGSATSPSYNTTPNANRSPTTDASWRKLLKSAALTLAAALTSTATSVPSARSNSRSISSPSRVR